MTSLSSKLFVWRDKHIPLRMISSESGYFVYFCLISFLDSSATFFTLSSNFGHLRQFSDDFVSLWKFASVVVSDSCSLLGCSSGVFDERRLATNENLKWQYPKREERALWTSSILLWAQLQNWFQMFIYSKISIQTISLPPRKHYCANWQIWNPQNF